MGVAWWRAVAAAGALVVTAATATAAGAAVSATAPGPTPEERACLSRCKPAGPEAAVVVCYDICMALHAQNKTDCTEALLGSSFQHTTLLSFSSGHVLETIAVLQGAFLGGNGTSELATFLLQSHLNDRGSPAACSDVSGAHYCLGRGPPTLASLGLCLPQSCGSAFIEGMLANLTTPSDSSGGSVTASGGGGGSGGGAFAASLTFSCGDDLRVRVDSGTVAVFYLIGALVFLALVGTGVDYEHRRRREHHHRDLALGGGDLEGSEEQGRSGSEEEELKQGTVLLPARSLLDFVIPDAAWPVEDDSGIRQRLLRPSDGGAAAAAAAEAGGGEQQLPPIGEEVYRRSVSSNGGQQQQQQQQRQRQQLGDGGGQALVLRRCGGWCREHLECFSLMANVESLVAPPRAGDEFCALDGVRTLSMLWVVLGHTVLYNCTGIGGGYSNLVDVLPHDGEGLFSRLSGQVIPGSFLAVDTFFLMSGFLLSSMLLPKLDSGCLGAGRGWIAEAYLHRYLRLMPTLAFVMLVFWKVLPLLGDGPVFWPLARAVDERCSRWWWTEITFLSNVLPWPPLSDGCTLVTWYLSDDFMFFLAGVPLVALCHRLPRAGVALTVLAAVSSCLFTLLWYGFHEDARLSYFALARTPYVAPWARCPPYLVGLLCGVIWHAKFRASGNGSGNGSGSGSSSGSDGGGEDDVGEDVGNGGGGGGGGGGGLEVEADVNPSRRKDLIGRRRHNRSAQAVALVVLAALASSTLMALTVYGTYWAYQDTEDSRLSPWADHLYLAFSRPAWALGVALMCLLCFCGHGGFVNWLLTRPGWTAPSRLTYCAYLVHTGLLTLLYGSRDLAVELTGLEYAVTYMGVVMGTFAGAAVLHLLVEAPFRNLESLGRRRRQKLLRWRTRE